MTDEGVIIFEEICSLKNSIQLKLAFICWQTGHHIWNRKKLEIERVWFVLLKKTKEFTKASIADQTFAMGTKSPIIRY